MAGQPRADGGKAQTAGPRLVELTGSTAGRVHELRFGEQTVGRGGATEIGVEHPDVSRQHARLSVGPDGVRVHDLGSKNGVTAFGKPVDGSILLTHGQTFSLGALQLRVFHPATQVSRALVDAGETTATTTAEPNDREALPMRGLLIPVVGVLLFGLLLAAMLMG